MQDATRLKMLNKLGMRLASDGQHRAALMLLGMALRLSLNKGLVMQEAKIRNNIALVLHLSEKYYLARRQFLHSLMLVAKRVGIDNRFYRLVRRNLIQSLHAEGCLEEMAA